MSISKYHRHEKWEDAVSNTDDGLSPIAVKLIHVPDLPPIDAELALGGNHYPYVIVCMTTVFKDEQMNGKLGWRPLEGEVRQNMSQIMHDNGIKDEWAFFLKHRAPNQLS